MSARDAGVCLVIGAGDATGAAIARRFAAGGGRDKLRGLAHHPGVRRDLRRAVRALPTGRVPGTLSEVRQ